MRLDHGEPIVKAWLDANPETRVKKTGALARFHGLVLVACHEARRDRVPLEVVSRILRGLGDPCAVDRVKKDGSL